MRAHGRKYVAAVKSRRQGSAGHPVAIRDLACALNSIAVLHQRDEPVIGQHKILSSFRFDHYRFPGAANRRVHHYYEDRPGRIVWRRAVEEAGTVENRERRDLMSQV